jgi:hypothetical protein
VTSPPQKNRVTKPKTINPTRTTGSQKERFPAPPRAARACARIQASRSALRCEPEQTAVGGAHVLCAPPARPIQTELRGCGARVPVRLDRRLCDGDRHLPFMAQRHLDASFALAGLAIIGRGARDREHDHSRQRKSRREAKRTPSSCAAHSSPFRPFYDVNRCPAAQTANRLSTVAHPGDACARRAPSRSSSDVG